jgi:hypothetical protein
MILSTKITKRIPVGIHAAKIIGFEYAKAPDNTFLVLKTGEKGLQCTFYIPEYKTEMFFTFWLRKDLEYQLRGLSKAAGCKSVQGTLYTQEMVGNMVFILLQQEIYFRGGEPIVDTLGEPISNLKVCPKFFIHNYHKKPIIKEKHLAVIKYMDGLDKLHSEK